MYVPGLSSQKSRPPSSTRATQPENFVSRFHAADLREAIASTHQ